MPPGTSTVTRTPVTAIFVGKRNKAEAAGSVSGRRSRRTIGKGRKGCGLSLR
ncbi:hypothetical protein HanRHA438_Chr14g0637111 [Helianthus annuus]|nr:hypothetical protein HanRHA438_Chr14g0637111 [Helianthus annuus]